MFLSLPLSILQFSSLILLPSPYLFQTCSCRVHDNSFWSGLLVPFGIIYIINWIIFILIFASLLCRPNVRKTGNNGNFHKLKANFMIALGLSLLFGMGWAVGLLASSDLPGAVRYPAEWIFTLMTAFLGVYLFALYILRSSEARGLWKRWFLCQRKKKPFVGVSSTTPSRTNLGNLSSTIRSWWKTNILRRPCRDTSAISNTVASNTTSMSTNTAAKVTDMTAPYVEPSSVLASTTITSPHLPPVELEVVQKMDMDALERESNSKEHNPNPVSSSDVSVKLDVETESCIERVMSSHDNMSVRSFNSLSSSNDPSPSGAHGECYTVESKQTEGADTK